MESACDLLLYRTYFETWQRGEAYADEGRVKILRSSERLVEALVEGTETYEVKLEFRSGGISRSCSCPVGDFCKHMVAVAIVWDELRGLKRPDPGEIGNVSVPPPLVSYSDVSKAFRNPLKADLDIIRLASSELGNWSRPHARLPSMPHFNADEKNPLTVGEMKKAFQSIAGWSNRSRYDFYFCAGEMVAAFCEVMRMVKKRLAATPPLVAAEILREAQKFHYELIMELIDDSDGLHEFTEAHLEDIYQKLKKSEVSDKERETFEDKLEEFDDHRDDY